MTFLPGWMPRIKPMIPASLAITASNGFGPGSANVQFNGVSIGAAPGFGERRYMLVAFGLAEASSITVSTALCNGVSMTLIVQRNNTTPNVSIWGVELTTGTTANFQINCGSTPAVAYIAVWRAINISGLTPFGTASANHSGGVLNLNCNVPGNGCVIGIAQANNAGGSGSNTWTGLTEQDDYDVASGEVFTMAHQTGTGASSPRTISVSNSDTTPGGYQGVVASFSPA